MARVARIKSEMGIYHVMLRGVNKHQVFFDEEDYRLFTSILKYYKKVCGFNIYAYCIMGNHIHLLMKTNAEPLGEILKRVECAFVYWYNAKYERTGHLFQGRYKSEAVNTEKYFLTVLRYILQNPVKAGLCKGPQYYCYSSGKEYFFSNKGITDTAYALTMLDKASLQAYILEENSDQCLEATDAFRKRITDTTAKTLILKEFGTYSPLSIEEQDKSRLDASIRKLCADGISIRQLGRLTGIPKSMIEKTLK